MTDDQETQSHLKKRKPKLIERPAPEQVLPVIEAVLFVADQPVEVATLARSINAPRDEVLRALDALAQQCRERGVRLQRAGELVQLVSAPETAAYVERFLGMELPRLTDASLETLAIIAYRQPIARAGIEAVRGVECDGPIRTLLARELIAEVGRAPVIGRPTLFGTTVRFLEYFGLERPDDLPPLPSAGEAIEDGDEAAI